MRLSALTVLLVLASLGVAGCLKKTGPKPAAEGAQELSWKDPAQEQAWLNAYHNSRFGFCDARMLADLWQHSVEDAQARVGMKLKAGVEDWQIDKWFIDPAREKAIANGLYCDPFDEGYKLSDVEALAQAWGIGVSDAKLVLSEKLVYGGRELADYAVQDAWMSTDGAYYDGEYDEGMEDEGYLAEAFWQSALTYCDARLLAEWWGVDPWDAKVALGQKVTNGFSLDEIERDVMGPAREHARKRGEVCAIWEGDVSYEDADALACFWGTTLEDAKVRIGQKLTNGDKDILDRVLSQARSACP
ncbi:MAG: hypothetical protein H6739_10975 [Alphaproteobacteria bacterium]|nr:hypothetical protein [Alphaproteobacteria bacterium]